MDEKKKDGLILRDGVRGEMVPSKPKPKEEEKDGEKKQG
jgi:hypothetical protein